jgi:hypothetical protein
LESFRRDFSDRTRVEQSGKIIRLVKGLDGDERESLLGYDGAVANRIVLERDGAERGVHAPPYDFDRREGRFADVINGPERGAALITPIRGASAQDLSEFQEVFER